MGLFFEKVEKKKRTKPVLIAKILLVIVMIICLILGVANELDIFYFRIVFLVAGAGSVMDGMESYFQKLDKKVYLSEFSIAAVMFLFAVFSLNFK